MKKKILVIISGGLPIPSIKGGAVETLIDMYINENEKKHYYDFDVYSTYCENIENYNKSYKYTNFYYIHTEKIKYQILRYIRAFCHKILKLPVMFKFVAEILKDIEFSNRDYDLVIVENNASLVPPLAKKFKNKVILHLHNDNVNNTIQDGIEIYNDCRRIFTVSDYIKNRCLTCKKEKNENKVVTLFNGINREKFIKFKIEENKSKDRKKYGIKDNDLVFMFSGRVCDDKGVKELLNAFNMLRETTGDSKIKLLIVGGSFFSSGKKTPYIKELIKIAQKNLNNIIFTGYVDYNEMGKIYNIADIQVVPSKFDDPCPLTILEGMTMGLPQIASKCGGIPEEVTADNAILVDRDDLTNNLFKAMLKLYESPELREKMSKSSIKRAEKFDECEYTKNFYKLLEREFENGRK